MRSHWRPWHNRIKTHGNFNSLGTVVSQNNEQACVSLSKREAEAV